MNITVNGDKREVPDGQNVQQLLQSLGFATGTYAVALNLEFVPRGDYAKTHVKNGDELEIVAPRQGG